MFLVFIISDVIYIVATVMIYHNVYNLEKVEKIELIVIGFIITFIITAVICSISTGNIVTNNTEMLSITKNTAMWIFAPINAIIAVPYIGNCINKYKANKINSSKLKKRIGILLIVFFFLMIIETGYIKDFQMGLLQSTLNR